MLDRRDHWDFPERLRIVSPSGTAIEHIFSGGNASDSTRPRYAWWNHADGTASRCAGSSLPGASR